MRLLQRMQFVKSRKKILSNDGQRSLLGLNALSQGFRCYQCQELRAMFGKATSSNNKHQDIVASTTFGPSKRTINRHMYLIDFTCKRPKEDPYKLTVVRAQ